MCPPASPATSALPSRYVRRQPQIPLPVHLRHDRLGHRGSCLRGYFHHGQRHRRRRHPRHSVHPACYMLSFALCMVIAIVVPFVLTVSVGKKKGIA